MFSKVLIFALAVVVANCQLKTPRGLAIGVAPKLLSQNLAFGGSLGLRKVGLGKVGLVSDFGYAQPHLALPAPGLSKFAYGVPAISQKFLAIGAPAISKLAIKSEPIISNWGIKAAVPAISTLGLGYGLGYGSLGYRAAGLANLNIARGVSVGHAGPINAAVQTISRTVDYTPVPYSGEPAVEQQIDVPPMESPIRINFQSKSSPLALSQMHIPAEPGQIQTTQSEDEPHKVVHNVVRPVVQQVNEVVQPVRTLTQTVEPVFEQIHSNYAQGEGVKLTGLTSGIVGGSGVLGASGYGLAVPAVAKVGGYGLGLGYGLNSGLYGSKIINSGLGLGYGLNTGLYGSKIINSGLGLGYGLNTGLYGSKIINSGLGLGYGLGAYRTAALAAPIAKYAVAAPAGVIGLNGISTYGLGLNKYGLGLSNYGLGLSKYTTGIDNIGLDLGGLTTTKVVKF